MRIHLPDETNIYKWEVLIEGPPSTPYASGHFRLQITLPTEYPFKPPLLNFATKIYHPNVSNDEKGAMCLGMLRSDQWKPPNKIRAVLEMLGQLMGEPDCDDAVETGGFPFSNFYLTHVLEGWMDGWMDLWANVR